MRGIYADPDETIALKSKSVVVIVVVVDDFR